MNIAQLAQTIRDDASRQAHAYRRETDAMVAAIERETEAMVTGRREELMRIARAREAARRAQLEAQQEIETRMQVLQQRQLIIDSVFARAAKELGTLEGTKRTRLLTRLWAKTKEFHDPEVIVAKNDAAFFTKRATVREKIPGLGGFIAISGKQRMDLRFETLLDEARGKLTPEIARILWGPSAKKATARRKR